MEILGQAKHPQILGFVDAFSPEARDYPSTGEVLQLVEKVIASVQK